MGGVLAVIPARFASSRFPGKALADLGGAPLVVRVAERAARIPRVDEVVVATDDARIQAAVTAAGLACELTGEHATGTDRVGAVAARRDAEIVLNLQGDEPLLDPADVDRLIAALQADARADLGTLAHRFDEAADWRDLNVVKVLVDRAGRAMYFSRAALPGAFPGGGRPDAGAGLALRHVGVYAYRADALRRFLELPRTPLEQAEGLEQLRALEHGMSILVLEIGGRPIGVDTPADLERVRSLWRP